MWRWLIVVLVASCIGGAAVAQQPQSLQAEFQPAIRPLLKKLCFECHSGKKIEAEIDLAKFVRVSDIDKAPRLWQKVREMLDSGQMPPKDSRQPSDPERKRLRAWVRGYLTQLAEANAGDPGRVVLRRLSNSEYTYTLRDLTGLSTLSPAKEFPIGGAAGEGFTNTGDAMVMSPSLVRKYLDAAKKVAAHAVLLPDGMRFSSKATRRDWTDESLAEIRKFYATYVNVEDGRMDLEKYLAVTLKERVALRSGAKSIREAANLHGVNAVYLGKLWNAFHQSPARKEILMGRIREQWQKATVDDAARLAKYITSWQAKLWTFKSVGQIGRAGGPKAWMEPLSPVVAEQKFSLSMQTGGDVTVYLSATDAGDGNQGDIVVWKNPRLVGKGLSDLSLRYVAEYQRRLLQKREAMLSKTSKYLAAAAEASNKTDARKLAAKHGLDAVAMQAWLDLLQLEIGGRVTVSGHFSKTMKNGTYGFVSGWGTNATPLVMANSSDQQVRIPGISRPHSVVAHPSPTLFAAVGWQSPIDGEVQLEARVEDAHPECGNGVEWLVRHRSGHRVANLWKGDFAVRGKATMKPRAVKVRKGELISLVVGPRASSHTCDLTEINLVVRERRGKQRVWNLAKDASPNILASNPLADRYGNKRVWHFYQGEMKSLNSDSAGQVAIPANSTLAKWRATKDADMRSALAARMQGLATGKLKPQVGSPDEALMVQVGNLKLPYDAASLLEGAAGDRRFGRHVNGQTVSATDLVVKAPSVLKFTIPAELAAGRQLVVSGQLDEKHGQDGSVQLSVAGSQPARGQVGEASPFVAAANSRAAKRVETDLESVRNLFPPALCYTRIVPVDEVVTLTLYYREDHHLRRLMLNEQQQQQLDRMWDELIFVSQEPYKRVVALEQIREFATQDRPDLVVALRVLHEPTQKRAAEFGKRLIASQPVHLSKVLEFADRAWRRSLTPEERKTLQDLYQQIREQGLKHDTTIRLLLARVLTSPAFLYRLERPTMNDKPSTLSGNELASRLSYFLWSSMPDAGLRQAASLLADPKATSQRKIGKRQALVKETKRMLRDPRSRRLAIEFACQWLHVRDFDQNDEKNEKLYPRFAQLRGLMYEETVRFFEDLIRNDGSVMGILDADHTFLNQPLAEHYGVPGVKGAEWRRVEGMRAKGRGGILGMATILAKQSGASRTSPILRGNWVSETLLGERLPRPPANVPILPEQVPEGLTARELIQRHSSAPACAKCHVRIDPYGFALEQFDAVGRLRAKKVDTRTQLMDGKSIEGIKGLRGYLSKERRDDFLHQFCRKLLGYSLGRSVQLSDEPLLAKMKQQLQQNDFRFSVAVETIVTSRQFQQIRGRQSEDVE